MAHHNKVFHITEENLKIIKEYVTHRQNQKPIDRPRNLESSIRKLADFLKETSLKNATEEQLKYFFNPKNNIISITSRTYYFNQIKLFYQYIDNIDRFTIPKRLRFYQPLSKKELRRHKDIHIKEKHLITQEDYQKIIQHSNDAYGQNKALFETLYLSGARPEEIAHLKIKDITIQKNSSKVTIEIRESKTIQRLIPLPAPAYKLIKWLGSHPFRENKESSLWLSYKTQQPIKINQKDPSDFIRKRLNVIKNIDKTIKQTISPKSFRKTRATQLFNDDKLSIGDISQIMGWTIATTEQRRKEYELTDTEDIKKKVWAFNDIPTDYDSIKQDRDNLKKQLDDILKLKDYGDDIKSMTKRLNGLQQSIQALRPNINPYYMDTPPYYHGQPNWIQTHDNKMQLTYMTEDSFMKEFLEEPITIEEFKKNNHHYAGQLAKFLYENKLTKKITFEDEENITTSD